MQESYSTTTYRGIRIDDTAEWRLVIYLSECFMSAYLKNIENPIEPLVVLFEERWNRDEGSLLRRIEKAVYDHPQVMDDFSTDIVICTDRTVWAPLDVCNDDEIAAEVYNRIYSGDEEDVHVDTLGDCGCIFSLVRGLSSFLRRTLSGARVLSHQSVMVKRFISRGGDMPKLYVEIRDGAADYALIDDRRLLLSVTHSWSDLKDISYMVFNIMDVYGIGKKNIQVSLSGVVDVKQQLLRDLREQLPYVMLTMVPTVMPNQEVPLAVALALSK